MVTFNERYEKYKNKISTMAWNSLARNNALNLEKEDIEQELYIVLWNAHNTFDKSKNTEFSTYFYTLANNRLSNIVSSNFTQSSYLSNVDLESLNTNVENTDIEKITTIIDDNSMFEDEVFVGQFLEDIYEMLGDDELDKDVFTAMLFDIPMRMVAEKHNRHQSGLFKRRDKIRERIKRNFKLGGN